MAAAWLDVNPVLLTALTAALSAQVLKFLLYAWYRRRARLERLLGAGGMPSSHSAMVAALVTGIGRRYGPHSSAFAVATVFGLIVLYDAIGVRRAVGLQARYLNRLQRALSVHPVRMGEEPQDFPEYIGHTPVEVLIGTLWGVAWAIWG